MLLIIAKIFFGYCYHCLYYYNFFIFGQFFFCIGGWVFLGDSISCSIMMCRLFFKVLTWRLELIWHVFHDVMCVCGGASSCLWVGSASLYGVVV